MNQKICWTSEQIARITTATGPAREFKLKEENMRLKKISIGFCAVACVAIMLSVVANAADVHSDATGKATTLEFNAMVDGKDYPGTGLQSGADSVSVELVDANTVRVKQKKAGKVVMTVTSVVSADGKTRTSTFVGVDAAGKDVKNVVVYDKQ